MKIFLVTLAAVFSIGSAASSCSFDGAWPFLPDVEGWQPFDGQDEYLGDIPAPKVVLRELRRGREAPGVSCGDAGTLRLLVSLPGNAQYKITDLGVYFRVIEGQNELGIFPDRPLVGEVRRRGFELQLPWLDGHPSDQIPIEMSVEVFFVSKALQIGRPSVIKIVAD
ncbi:hypothetical protein [Pseudophaeobacter sp.]|uniref:hypothetical protein n=1 Tax=Pseudophaeobacter sp. TaxID=1971739 RepID=UPI003298403E